MVGVGEGEVQWEQILLSINKCNGGRKERKKERKKEPTNEGKKERKKGCALILHFWYIFMRQLISPVLKRIEMRFKIWTRQG